MTDADTLDLADRMFSAIEDGDLDGLLACYDPGIVVWTNVDQRDKDLARSIRVIEWLWSRLSDRHYDVTRRDVIPGGFLQEHLLRGTAADGTAVAMPACIVATVADGRIVRINEYLDPAGIAALLD